MGGRPPRSGPLGPFPPSQPARVGGVLGPDLLPALWLPRPPCHTPNATAPRGRHHRPCTAHEEAAALGRAMGHSAGHRGPDAVHPDSEGERVRSGAGRGETLGSSALAPGSEAGKGAPGAGLDSRRPGAAGGGRASPGLRRGWGRGTLARCWWSATPCAHGDTTVGKSPGKAKHGSSM